MASVATAQSPSQQQEAAPSSSSSGIDGIKAGALMYLYASHGPLVDAKLGEVEKQTGVKREQMASVGGAIVALYLILGSAAQLLCNMIGFAYPAYASVKAIRTDRKDDDTQWLTYWTVFGVFTCMDFFAEGIMSWFPFYYLLKSIFLLYLYLPQTLGAQKLYVSFVDPLVQRIDLYMGNAAPAPASPAPQ